MPYAIRLKRTLSHRRSKSDLRRVGVKKFLTSTARKPGSRKKIACVKSNGSIPSENETVAYFFGSCFGASTCGGG